MTQEDFAETEGPTDEPEELEPALDEPAPLDESPGVVEEAPADAPGEDVAAPPPPPPPPGAYDWPPEPAKR